MPATIAVLDGVARIGLDKSELERVAGEPGLRKLGFRDLPAAAALGASGATTVSATSFLAARAGIRVFATGGLGGVHRGWTESQDESADLDMLSRTRITVVCAGVKSILDVPATLQRLETRGVTIAGFRTDEFPGFYLHSSGEPIDWRIETPDEAAGIMRAQDALGGPETALIVANPVPLSEQLDPELHDRVLAGGPRRGGTAADHRSGHHAVPAGATWYAAPTGASLEANLAAVRGNVRVAGQIAASWSRGN